METYENQHHTKNFPTIYIVLFKHLLVLQVRAFKCTQELSAYIEKQAHTYLLPAHQPSRQPRAIIYVECNERLRTYIRISHILSCYNRCMCLKSTSMVSHEPLESGRPELGSSSIYLCSYAGWLWNLPGGRLNVIMSHYPT